MSPEYKHRCEVVASQIVSPFRGGIAKNCERFRFIGSGYKGIPKEQDGHFIPETAKQCNGPMLALEHPMVRVVHIIGATQVLKSIVGDAWAVWSIEYERLPFIAYFEDDPKARTFCRARLMETIRKHPHLQNMLLDAKEVSRHNLTGTEISFVGFMLLVCGLNDGNASTLEWPRIWISEGWLHPDDGLIEKAFKRADHFPKTKKILNESQASMAGTDLHRKVQEAHKVPYEWQCVHCGGWQTWEWEDWSRKHSDGTYSGMKWTDAGTIDDKAAAAWWECSHCRKRIDDTPENRQKIAESSKQDFINPATGIPYENVAFFLPYECAVMNSFKESVKSFLTAKASKEAGNDLPMQDWFLQWRGFFYEKEQGQWHDVSTQFHKYPDTDIPNLHSVNMLVDCQKAEDAETGEDRMGSFWVLVEAVDKFGNVRHKGWFYCTSKEQVEKIQERYKIPAQRVCVDGRKWTAEVKQWAARNYQEVDAIHPLFKKPYKKKFSWIVLMGDNANYYNWVVRGRRVALCFSPPMAHQERIMRNGTVTVVDVPLIFWSNTTVKDQLSAVIIGGVDKPKIEFLSSECFDEQTRAKCVGQLEFQEQVHSEYRTELRGKPFWEKKSQRPNHAWDCMCMGLVRRSMDGLSSGTVEVSAV